MKVINLQGGDDTPSLVLDKENSVFEISGRSLPEDSTAFYKPVLEWLEVYATDANPETKFHFKLEYFNTASSKLILDLLSKLEDIDGVVVIWYFHEDDEDMQEAGEEFSELVNVEFEFKSY